MGRRLSIAVESVRRAWSTMAQFVPTRRALVLLSLGSGGVYLVEALAWPMVKGRDLWDYWSYYLEMWHGGAPFHELMLFRTPLTPLVVGLPMQVGGPTLLEIVFGVLYMVSIVAWSAAALTFSRLTAVLVALVLLAYPGYAALYHEASSDAVFATGFALWALLAVRVGRRPSGRRFALLGVSVFLLVMIRPANEVLLAAFLLPLAIHAPWRKRLAWSATLLASAVVLLAGWAAYNGLRYGDYTVARGSRAWVPFFRLYLVDHQISPTNGPASRRLATAIGRDVLTQPQYRELGVGVDGYLTAGSNFEAIRLIALSDRDFGHASNYDVLFRAGLEAIERHPGRYLRGVLRTYRAYLREGAARGLTFRHRIDTTPPTAKTIINGQTVPNPAALSPLLVAARYGFVWCPTDDIDRCIVRNPSLVWKDPIVRRRYVSVVGQVRSWNAELPPRNGQAWLDRQLFRLQVRFPLPVYWLVVAAVALVVRRPRGALLLVALTLAAGLVLAIHALSQPDIPEYAIPVYPAFILAGIAALTGMRAACDSPAPPS